MREDAVDRETPTLDCSIESCSTTAAYFLFDADDAEWLPLCSPHTEQRHPSLEVHAWMAAGLVKPVELGRPESPPSDPGSDRGRRFRDEVVRTMGWDELSSQCEAGS
jgi:hypothetical protein